MNVQMKILDESNNILNNEVLNKIVDKISKEEKEHQKNNNSQQMQSERIRTRCIELLKLLDSNKVKRRLEILLEATKGHGKDLEFLNRWRYSNTQIKAISKSIYEVALP